MITPMTIGGIKDKRESTNNGCRPTDCLSYPLFYDGQPLSAGALTSVLEYAKARFSLLRLRDGWGVVCGLNISSVSANPRSVVVESGYAVDQCGHDIVLCKQVEVDLTPQLPPPPVSECDWTAKLGQSVTKPCPQLRITLAGEEYDCYIIDLSIRWKPNDDKCMRLEGVRVPVMVEETVAIEASLDCSGSIEFSPLPAVTKQYIERKQGLDDLIARLTFQVEQDDDPEDPDKQNQQHYPSLEHLLEKGNKDDIIAKLRKWLNRYPLDGFAFVEERIQAWEASPGQNPAITESELTTILFWIFQDQLNQHFRCECSSTVAGVPIGRIWIGAHADQLSGATARVLLTETRPPFQVPFGNHCWNGMLGSLDLGRFIWQEKTWVVQQLADLGIGTTFTELQPPATLHELAEWLRNSLGSLSYSVTFGGMVSFSQIEFTPGDYRVTFSTDKAALLPSAPKVGPKQGQSNRGRGRVKK